jgi:Ca-activated chloride channel family protein
MVLDLPLCVLSLAFSIGARAQSSQAPPESGSPFTLRVPVNEISLTFHASNGKGAPLTGLTVADLQLSDAGNPEHRIMMLQSYQDLPIRAGFIFDASASMLRYLQANQSMIFLYASQLLRKGVDRAFVMQFEAEPLLRQSWTDNDASIAAGAADIMELPGRLPVTAIFDTLYRACRDQWKPGGDEATGNFILLFTDGEDDASHVYLSEAIDMCQRTRTAIYAIVNRRKSRSSEGQNTLQELASKSGGKVFFHPQGGQILEDLQTIEAEQRNQYRLTYTPSNFKADGSFHPIHLTSSVKGAQIVARSGYYAFPRK